MSFVGVFLRLTPLSREEGYDYWSLPPTFSSSPASAKTSCEFLANCDLTFSWLLFLATSLLLLSLYLEALHRLAGLSR